MDLRSGSRKLAATLALALAVPVAAMTAGATGCGDDLPKPQLVVNLRIVGIQAEPPEAPAGATVDLSALLLQPEVGAAVERQWAACVVPPGVTTTGCLAEPPATLPPDCADAPEASFCLLGDGESATYTLPASALSGRPPGAPGQVVITLLAASPSEGGVAACAVALTDPEAAPESCRAAIKRVSVLAGGVAASNANPSLASLTRDGERLVVTLGDGSVETTPDGPESLFLSWYVTGGELDKFRTDGDETGFENQWVLPLEPGDYQAAVVVRDGRGGEDWAVLDVTVP